MKFLIKTPAGAIIETLNITTSIRESYLDQLLASKNFTSDLASSLARGIIYLASEQAAVSVIVCGYTIEKKISLVTNLDFPTNKSPASIKPSSSSLLNPSECVALALIAANQAGDEWMKQAQSRYTICQTDTLGRKVPSVPKYVMLDVCGNAHIQLKDKRTVNYKNFLAAGCIRNTNNATVDINHKYTHRQEMGLKLACAEAAKLQLELCGVTGLRILSYID